MDAPPKTNVIAIFPDLTVFATQVGLILKRAEENMAAQQGAQGGAQGGAGGVPGVPGR